MIVNVDRGSDSAPLACRGFGNSRKLTGKTVALWGVVSVTVSDVCNSKGQNQGVFH